MADDEQKYENDCCDDDVVHSGAVERVKAAMPDEDMLYDAAELFKVFGDSTRTRILSALFIEELCVCDIAEILGMTKSAVSHQLRTLRQTKIVKARRSGERGFLFARRRPHLAHLQDRDGTPSRKRLKNSYKGDIIMKKVIRLQDLDCANCAAKMERGIEKIKGVNSVSVDFMTQKIVLDCDDNAVDEIIVEMKKVCHKIEPDCIIKA